MLHVSKNLTKTVRLWVELVIHLKEIIKKDGNSIPSFFKLIDNTDIDNFSLS